MKTEKDRCGMNMNNVSAFILDRKCSSLEGDYNKPIYDFSGKILTTLFRTLEIKIGGFRNPPLGLEKI